MLKKNIKAGSNPYSSVADIYAFSRPQYPYGFFEIIKDRCQHKVVATDISLSQLSHAFQSPQIEYLCSPAEEIPFEKASLDLITVGQALHWLDIKKFYQEVFRTLKPGALIAVINYQFIPSFFNHQIDDLLNDLAKNILKNDWPIQASSLGNVFEYPYQNFYFPFKNVQYSSLNDIKPWSRQNLISYLRTWSGVQNYINRTGIDPLKKFDLDLEKFWKKNHEKKIVYWQYGAYFGIRP